MSLPPETKSQHSLNPCQMQESIQAHQDSGLKGLTAQLIFNLSVTNVTTVQLDFGVCTFPSIYGIYISLATCALLANNKSSYGVMDPIATFAKSEPQHWQYCTFCHFQAKSKRMIPHWNLAHKEPFQLCTSCDIMVNNIWDLCYHMTWIHH